jgi:hypothetical protein
VKVNWRFAKVAAVAAAIAVASLAMLPAVSASASTGVVADWKLPNTNIGAVEASYSCSSNTQTYEGLPLAEVRNSCGVRVWLHHYNSDGTIDAYCVNPDGGVAYGFSTGYTELQVSSTPTQCDSGAKYAVGWYGYVSNIVAKTYACTMGTQHSDNTYWVYSVSAAQCNFRIWLHNSDTGQSICISPQGTSGPYPTPVYLQLETTYNQAPCDAGPPPF